jgi:hypothetical protein
MRCRDSILGPARPHADYFLRTEICGKKCQTRDPRWDRTAGEKEVSTGLNILLEEKPDSHDERKIDANYSVINPSGLGAHAVASVGLLKLVHLDQGRHSPTCAA